MAFDTKKTANKNMFVASLVSKSTGHTASWINLTDTFCTRVFGCKITEVTAEMAEAKLPKIFESGYLAVHIVDTTIVQEVIPAEEF